MSASSNALSVLPGRDDDIITDAAMWRLVASGDLTNLTDGQKSRYYLHLCESMGLNPATQPFEYMRLNNKLVLYAKRTATDQLRKLHGVSIVGQPRIADDGEFITAEVTVQDRDGRTDFEIGAVFVGTLKGEGRANARMKALTKGKRRATLSICGLGMLDETEVDAVPTARTVPFPRGGTDRAGATSPSLPTHRRDVPEEGSDAAGPMTEEQRSRLHALAGDLGLDDASLDRACRKHEATDYRALSADQADAMIRRMEEAERMASAPGDGEAAPEPEPPGGDGDRISDAQMRKLWATANEKLGSLAGEGLHALVAHTYDLDSLKDLSRGNASHLIDYLVANDAEQVMGDVGPLVRQAAIDKGQGELPLDTGEVNEAEAARIGIGERAEAAQTEDEWRSLFAEAGDDALRWVALVRACPTLRRLDDVSAAAKQAAMYGPDVAVAADQRRAALMARADRFAGR